MHSDAERAGPDSPLATQNDDPRQVDDGHGIAALAA
jgi:hypothetical protein